MTKQALLVMDVQRTVVDRYTGDTEYLPRLGSARDAATSAGIPVIYAVIGFRPGFPEISPRNKIFGAIRESGAFAGDGMEVHPSIAPRAEDIVVAKKRVSAFAGSDLEMILRANEIDSLVLTGIATSGVVLSTVRQAADLDFALTVLSDGCLDADPEVHRVLTEKVFPRQADVLTVEKWTTGIQ